MIDWKRTFKETGKSKEYFDRFPNSHKKIWAICDGCYKGRYLSFQKYRDLCVSCSTSGKNNPMFNHKHTDKAKEKMVEAKLGKTHSKEHNKKIGKSVKGENNGMFGKKHSDETRQKMSDNRADTSGKRNPNYGNHKLAGENNPNWKGGVSKNRDYVLPFNQCLKINKYFKGSHRHHISADVIVYIPSELHYHIKHSLENGKNIYEMNMLALQYIRGWL